MKARKPVAIRRYHGHAFHRFHLCCNGDARYPLSPECHQLSPFILGTQTLRQGLIRRAEEASAAAGCGCASVCHCCHAPVRGGTASGRPFEAPFRHMTLIAANALKLFVCLQMKLQGIEFSCLDVTGNDNISPTPEPPERQGGLPAQRVGNSFPLERQQSLTEGVLHSLGSAWVSPHGARGNNPASAHFSHVIRILAVQPTMGVTRHPMLRKAQLGQGSRSQHRAGVGPCLCLIRPCLPRWVVGGQWA